MIDLIKQSIKLYPMDTFTALADPTRRQIVETLAAGERSFGEIAADFDISPPAVSQHLKVLRNAGVVAVRRDAQRRIYRIDAEGLSEIEEWITRVRRFWSGRLDRLESTLRTPPTDPGDQS
jgi:DNA-binding transcriptional ArsR family regulator